MIIIQWLIFSYFWYNLKTVEGFYYIYTVTYIETFPYLVKTNINLSRQMSDWATHGDKKMQHLCWSHSTQIGCKSMSRCYSNTAQASKRPCWATGHWKAQREHVSLCFTGSKQRECPTEQRPVCGESCSLYCTECVWGRSSALWCWHKHGGHRNTQLQLLETTSLSHEW